MYIWIMSTSLNINPFSQPRSDDLDRFPLYSNIIIITSFKEQFDFQTYFMISYPKLYESSFMWARV